MKRYRKAFYFLLLIPITILVYEIRTTLIDMRHSQDDLFLLNAQRASQQRLIIGLQSRILHYTEDHGDEDILGCPACFGNLLVEKYDHPLIRKFLTENGVDADSYFENKFSEEDLK